MAEHFSFVVDTLPVAYYKLPFITEKSFISETPVQTETSVVYSSHFCEYDYGKSIYNMDLLKGQYLHKAGFCGDGMLICAFDGAWKNCETVLQPLYENGQIWGTRDLAPCVNNVYIGNEDVHPYYNVADHGTSTLSLMACCIEGQLVGTAPRANYFLIRTENPWGENLVEEDFWAQGAEIADSLGADVVTASVAYYTFDYEWQNIYTPADHNGMTSIASRAASILAHKGVLVAQGAGNNGAGPLWSIICRPADAFDILAVGAVNSNGVLAWYSSIGPSADGRVKPDVVSPGEKALALFGDGTIKPYGGTSCATPILAGLAACLWQALPQYSALEVTDLIRKYGDRYNNPDDKYGYGAPNFYQCYLDHSSSVPEKIISEFLVYPNPTKGELHVTCHASHVTDVEIFDVYGRKLTPRTSYLAPRTSHSSSLISIDISHLPQGIYIVKITAKGQVYTSKVVKIN